MPVGLLLPVLVLVGVLLTSLLVLRVDLRRQRLQARVEALAALGGEPESAAEWRHSIRLPQRRGARFYGFVSWALGLPADLNAVKIVPTWVVCVIGILAAIADTAIGRLYFSLPIAALGGIVTGLVVARAIFRWQFGRYVSKLSRQLPDAIELLVSTTSAGLPASEGFRAITREMPEPTSSEFRRIVEEMALGVPVDETLRSLHHRTRVPEYAILAVTLAVQSRSGGRLVETVSTLAETIRQRMALVARARALAAEAKLSATVLGILPIFAGAMMSVIQPGFLRPLFFDPRGNKLLLIAIVTLALGILTMRQMIRGATSE
jgi:tight adherence protein B